MQNSSLAQEKGDQESTNSAITIQKWMDRFELRMDKSRMNQHRKLLIWMKEFLKCRECFLHLVWRGWDKGCFGEDGAIGADPVLACAKLTRLALSSADIGQQNRVDLPYEP